MQPWRDKKGICQHTQLSKKQVEALMRAGMPFCKLPSGICRFYVPDIDDWLRKKFQQNSGPTDATRTAADAVMDRLQ